MANVIYNCWTIKGDHLATIAKFIKVFKNSQFQYLNEACFEYREWLSNQENIDLDWSAEIDYYGTNRRCQLINHESKCFELQPNDHKQAKLTNTYRFAFYSKNGPLGSAEFIRDLCRHYQLILVGYWKDLDDLGYYGVLGSNRDGDADFKVFNEDLASDPKIKVLIRKIYANNLTTDEDDIESKIDQLIESELNRRLTKLKQRFKTKFGFKKVLKTS